MTTVAGVTVSQWENRSKDSFLCTTTEKQQPPESPEAVAAQRKSYFEQGLPASGRLPAALASASDIYFPALVLP